MQHPSAQTEPDFTMPHTMEPKDWDAVLRYLLATVSEVVPKPQDFTKFYHPESLVGSSPKQRFNVLNHYSDDLAEICLTIGLQPEDFRDLFNSACAGAQYESATHGANLEGFKGSHLTQRMLTQMLRHSGQANWQSFKEYYSAPEQVQDSKAWAQSIPQHNPDAPFRYPQHVSIRPENSASADIRISDGEKHNNASRDGLHEKVFHISFTPRLSQPEAAIPTALNVHVRVKDQQDAARILNLFIVRLEQDLIGGVDAGVRSVRSIAQLHHYTVTEAKQEPSTATLPPTVEPALDTRAEQLVMGHPNSVVGDTSLVEKGVPSVTPQTPVSNIPPSMDALLAAGKNYWEKFERTPESITEIMNLGSNALATVNTMSPPALLAGFALKHYAFKNGKNPLDSAAKQAFVEQYGNQKGNFRE